MNSGAAHAGKEQLKALSALGLEIGRDELHVQVLFVQILECLVPIFVKIGGTRAGTHVLFQFDNRHINQWHKLILLIFSFLCF